MSDSSQATIILSAEERDLIWFIPQAEGGKLVPERVQLSLEAKGICTMNPTDGRRWLTVFGDRVRRGVVPVRIEG
ncbi:hypothetical protein [Roseateles violae]|uniref:Uncharacterized protein n=1 Tax=Roseateles violae TaxID=3058042 RepID=A0ABT8DVN9_9BURK|nr:hypothetical protein [Pelomonas sp. PFR6]MDN3922370.1 hypothetical protein [Pelomonas sp. PFR6]